LLQGPPSQLVLTALDAEPELDADTDPVLELDPVPADEVEPAPASEPVL
jgi:hypothetical protein